MSDDANNVSGEERWAERGAILAKKLNRSAWDIGDWLLDGGRWDVGYAKSEAITGFSRSYLSNLFRTSHAWPIELRRTDVLSHSAHVELLRITDQATRLRVFNEAVEKEYNQTHIRNMINALGDVSKKAKPENESRYVPRNVKCPNCDHVFPIKGNKVP